MLLIFEFELSTPIVVTEGLKPNYETNELKVLPTPMLRQSRKDEMKEQAAGRQILRQWERDFRSKWCRHAPQ